MNKTIPNRQRRSFMQACALSALPISIQPTWAKQAPTFKINGNMVPPSQVDIGEPLSEQWKQKLLDTGLSAFKWSLGGSSGSFAETLEMIKSLEVIYQHNSDVFMQIKSMADMHEAFNTNKIGIIYSFEASTMLEEDITAIQEFADLGVKIMQLSYNKSSTFGAGVMSAEPPLGLTTLGKRAVQDMQSSGVLVDLSHSHERTSLDVLNIVKKPVAITHSGCKGVFDHPRNKSDAELKGVADSGGVIGIYEMSYLTPSLRQQSMQEFMQHVMYAIKLCGVEHVGIGSDTPLLGFDTSEESMKHWNEINRHRAEAGIAAPGEGPPPYVTGMNSEKKMQIFESELRKQGLSQSEIDKVTGQNFARVFEDAWGSTD